MIDNIFTGLVREKTPGVILEFVLWCVVCFTALMSLIALAMGGGHATWILLMLFEIGLAVLMVFRLKAISLLYSVGAFYLIMPMIHYLCLSMGYSAGESHSPLNIILFVLILMLSLAATACAFVQFFSRYNIGTVLTILVITDAAAILLLQILMYASDYIGDVSYVNEYHRIWMNYRGYWIGTSGFWMLLAAVAVYCACFFWGPIDNRKGKIYGGGGAHRGEPGLQGLRGCYAGQVVYLRGNTLTIGSGEGVSMIIPDKNVSKIHCTIRFNTATGYYEILDQSSNGVWMQNGSQLQKGVYNSLVRGTVICIGNAEQQFRLL